MITNFVDQIFIINLDERTDRLKAVTKEMEKHHLEFERFPAIKPDRSEIPESQYNNMLGKINKDPYVIATCGVKQSHVEIIKIAKERGHKQVLILEDDVVFTDQFENLFNIALRELPKNWDMLFLGANHIEPFQLISSSIARVIKAYAIHAYIIRESMYDIIIDNAIDSGEEIDVYYANSIFPNFNCYCARPTLVWQKAGFSDIVQGFRDYKVIRK